MRLIISEKDSNGQVKETVILHLHEYDDILVCTEEVDDDDEHWANGFKTWRYNVRTLKDVIVKDATERRHEFGRRKREQAGRQRQQSEAL